MTALILTAIAFAGLWLVWHFINWVLDLIGEAQRQLRDQEWR